MECEFYVVKPGRGAGGAKYARELCSLTGRWCLIQVSFEIDRSTDRTKCGRRQMALDYDAKRYKRYQPRDADESHEMATELHRQRER